MDAAVCKYYLFLVFIPQIKPVYPRLALPGRKLKQGCDATSHIFACN